MRLSSVHLFAAFTALAMAATPSSLTSVPTYAPIPPAAVGPVIPNITGYHVEAFGHGAYMVTDGLYQSVFFVACDSVILVDAPPTIGRNILKAIRTVTDLPVTHLVYSHAHADHIGAAYLFKGPNVKFIAHEETLLWLSKVNDTTRPKPDITFSKNHHLHVCNQTLDLSYKGPNHHPGNIFIYAPKQKVLMLVDIVFPGWAPFDSLGEVQNVPGFIKAHDQLLEYHFDYFVGGHLNRYGTRQDVINQKEYITELYDNCAEGIRLSAAPPIASNPLSVETAFAVVKTVNPGNPWALFEDYLYDLVGKWCANKTNTAWQDRLAGLDVFGVHNAVTLIESLRIDYGILGPYGVASG